MIYFAQKLYLKYFKKSQNNQKNLLCNCCIFNTINYIYIYTSAYIRNKQQPKSDYNNVREDPST